MAKKVPCRIDERRWFVLFARALRSVKWPGSIRSDSLRLNDGLNALEISPWMKWTGLIGLLSLTGFSVLMRPWRSWC